VMLYLMASPASVSSLLTCSSNVGMSVRHGTRGQQRNAGGTGSPRMLSYLVVHEHVMSRIRRAFIRTITRI
jgi:hypothetical protein